MKKGVIIVVAVLMVCGCETFDKIGGSIYDPVTSTNIVDTAEGPISVVSTNGWTLKTGIHSGISLAGDVAPFPWAGLVANALIGVLGVGAALRGRRWKQAAVSGVHAAQIFKKELKSLSSSKAQEVKQNVILEQKTRGTQSFVQKILAEL